MRTSGAGAPIKSTRNTLEQDGTRRSKAFLHVNWDILRPIMAYCNEQCTLPVKSHKILDKAYGQLDVKWPNEP